MAGSKGLGSELGSGLDVDSMAPTAIGDLVGGAKFVIVAGKGGVGKTTVAASLARMAANTLPTQLPGFALNAGRTA